MIPRPTLFQRVCSVDLWLLTVPGPGADLTSCLAILDDAETARAARIVDAQSWRRFVAGRAARRELIAGYRRAAPESLDFLTGPRGKPAILGGPFFSTSFSSGLGVFAVSWTHPVGVDIERIRPIPEAAAITRRWLDATRPARREPVAAGDPEAAFVQEWVRHEALMKATGAGLAGPGTARSPTLVDWLTVDVPIDSLYVAALARANVAWQDLPSPGPTGPRERASALNLAPPRRSRTDG